jgi:hypothetical protein
VHANLFFIQERCAAAETVLLVARVLNRSKAHLQSVLSKNNTNAVEEFYRTLVRLFALGGFAVLPFPVGSR